MRVLVTGTTGMLGRGVALALADRGDDVTVLQRRPADLGLPEVLTDVADADAVRAAVTGHDAVIHLAAKVNVVGPEEEYLTGQRPRNPSGRRRLPGCRGGTSGVCLVSLGGPSRQVARRPRRRSCGSGDRARTVRPQQGPRGAGRARRRRRANSPSLRSDRTWCGARGTRS